MNAAHALKIEHIRSHSTRNTQRIGIARCSSVACRDSIVNSADKRSEPHERIRCFKSLGLTFLSRRSDPNATVRARARRTHAVRCSTVADNSADRPPPVHSGTAGSRAAYANGGPRPNPNPNPPSHRIASHRIASHRIAIAVCSHSFVWPSTALVGYHLVPPVKGSLSVRAYLCIRRTGACAGWTSRLYAVRPHCGASVETLPQASERTDLQGSAWYGTLRSCASTTDGLGAAARSGSAHVCIPVRGVLLQHHS